MKPRLEDAYIQYSLPTRTTLGSFQSAPLKPELSVSSGVVPPVKQVGWMRVGSTAGPEEELAGALLEDVTVEDDGAALEDNAITLELLAPAREDGPGPLELAPAEDDTPTDDDATVRELDPAVAEDDGPAMNDEETPREDAPLAALEEPAAEEEPGREDEAMALVPPPLVPADEAPTLLVVPPVELDEELESDVPLVLQPTANRKNREPTRRNVDGVMDTQCGVPCHGAQTCRGPAR